MLYLYTNIGWVSNKMPIILDPENCIYQVDFVGTDFQKKVLEEIEQGLYLNERTFIDKFGQTQHLDQLNYDSKALLVLDTFGDDHVVDMSKCCDHTLALTTLYMYNDRQMLIDNFKRRLDYYVNVPICVDGRNYDSIEIYNTYIMRSNHM